VTALLGIDVGTTGVRAAVFDATGRPIADALEACPYDAPAPGRAEIEPERWWDAVAGACRRLQARGALDGVEAIGVVGQAPTAALVDAAGRAIRPAILWLDVRAAEDARRVERALGRGRAEAIGGNRMHAYFLGPKLAWLRAHEPQALERAAWVLQSHAFVAMRMTGEVACDPSTAMLCAPLFDAAAGAWSVEAARAVDVRPELLPRDARAHDVVGRVTRKAAARAGLREGTPVVAGGGDFAASALGAGVVEEGEACLMLGTAGNLLLPLAAPRFDARLLNSHHVGCDRWLALSGTLCGAALEWFRGAFAPGVAWDVLEAEASAVRPGSDGVVMLPYLQGERTPIWDEDASGAFFGLTLSHGRGHLVRALFEGVALGFAHGLLVAEEQAVRVRVDRAVAANGAGRSALLRQCLADALGVPVTWSSDGAGGTAAGAAILAGLGAGVLRDVGAAHRWHEARRIRRWGTSPTDPHGGGPADPLEHLHRPDPSAHERLRETLSRRIALYRAELAARTTRGDTLRSR
jgi:xylulokinase